MATKKRKLPLSKACKAALKSEQALSLKMRGSAKPTNARKALARLNKLRRKIDTACPLPGMRR